MTGADKIRYAQYEVGSNIYWVTSLATRMLITGYAQTVITILWMYTFLDD